MEKFFFRKANGQFRSIVGREIKPTRKLSKRAAASLILIELPDGSIRSCKREKLFNRTPATVDA